MPRIPAFITGILAFALLNACSSHSYKTAYQPGQDSGYMLPAKQLPKDQEALLNQSVLSQNSVYGVDSIFYEGRYLTPAEVRPLFDTLDLARHDLQIVKNEFSKKKNLMINLKK